MNDIACNTINQKSKMIMLLSPCNGVIRLCQKICKKQINAEQGDQLPKKVPLSQISLISLPHAKLNSAFQGTEVHNLRVCGG